MPAEKKRIIFIVTISITEKDAKFKRIDYKKFNCSDRYKLYVIRHDNLHQLDDVAKCFEYTNL